MAAVLDSECVKRQRTCGLQEETSTSPNRRERPLIRKIGWGTTERDRDRWTERERKRECFMKKEDKSLIYLENVETAS